MAEMISRGALVGLILFLAGCASTAELPAELSRIDRSALPAPNINLNIPHLGPCTDSPDRSLQLNADQPVTVLVHGCFASAGRFRSLAQVFAFHGQQSICFSYDDRDSLTDSATQLVTALNSLAGNMRNRNVTVIGHSQGGLIARNALTAARRPAVRNDLNLRLVTISSPFAGIAAADHCGSTVARVVSLGLVVPICMLISGDKWYEITAASPFIRHPGRIGRQVRDFIKVVTDERDSCRQYDEDGRCLEDDYVFSIDEQYSPAVDESPRVVPVEVKAGHAEIVGNNGRAPDKLIAILQQQRVMRATSSVQAPVLEGVLQRLYLVQ